MATILLLSTADTELLAARAAGAGYRTANPTRVPLDEPEALARLTGGADIVVLRLLGGRQAWPEGIAALRATGLPLVALGGESAPDAEIMALSTVPAGVAAEALGYLREGGPANLRELAAFLSDTVLLTGEGFAPPEPAPSYGVHALPISAKSPRGCTRSRAADGRGDLLPGTRAIRQHRIHRHALRGDHRAWRDPAAGVLLLAAIGRPWPGGPAPPGERHHHHRPRGWGLRRRRPGRRR